MRIYQQELISASSWWPPKRLFHSGSAATDTNGGAQLYSHFFFCFTVDTHTGATKYKHSGDDWNYCERTQFPTDILQGPFSISELHVCVCVFVFEARGGLIPTENKP